MAWLLELGLFETIECSFLMVGHTHVNVDVPFGTLKVGMRKLKISTIENFQAQLPKLFKNYKEVTSWAFPQVDKVIVFALKANFNVFHL